MFEVIQFYRNWSIFFLYFLAYDLFKMFFFGYFLLKHIFTLANYLFFPNLVANIGALSGKLYSLSMACVLTFEY